MLIEDISNTSEWKFKSYEKIAEGTDRLKLSIEDFRYFKKHEWVVTEKIHGANFAIITDGLSIRYAKRKEMLLPEEDFFNHKAVKDNLSDKVEKLHKLILEEDSTVQTVTIYGELFGGCYPHPDIERNPDVEAIQTGIYYSPNIEFCAFDIAVEPGKGLERSYIDYDKSIYLFQKAGLMFAEPLFTGKFDDAFNYPVGFRTRIPEILGLPELDTDNKAEGIVIKPVKSIFLRSSKGIIRPIVKKKISEFDEESRFSEATNWSNKQITQTVYNVRSFELYKSELKELVNLNRLNNTISKIGRISKDKVYKDELSKQLFYDVLESFNSKNGDLQGLLGNNEIIKLNKYLKEEIRALIENYR